LGKINKFIRRDQARTEERDRRDSRKALVMFIKKHGRPPQTPAEFNSLLRQLDSGILDVDLQQRRREAKLTRQHTKKIF
jgi:hypothetical protein